MKVRALFNDDYVDGVFVSGDCFLVRVVRGSPGQCPVIVSLMSARLGLLVGESRRVQSLSCTWLSKRAVDKRRNVIVYSPVMIVSDGLLRASIPGKLKKLPCASWKLAFCG